MNRIELLFKEKKTSILSIYFTAGFPSLNDTVDILLHLENAGVDLIEIGMPFSDPLADGPVIQESSKQAIDNGMTIKLLLAQLQDIRKKTQIPLVLMGYLNPILQYGEIAFLEKCREIGIDGLILPDMPLDYFKNKLEASFKENGISPILLITPETSEERIYQVDHLSNGFLYMVSSNSITGKNNQLEFQEKYFSRIQKMDLKNPRLIGFGIRDRETFQRAAAYSQGAIIGTAFIEFLSKEGAKKETIYSFIKNIQ